jgi:hypothetical protein
MQLILHLEKSLAEQDYVPRELVREVRLLAEQRDQDLARYQTK